MKSKKLVDKSDISGYINNTDLNKKVSNSGYDIEFDRKEKF